MDRNIVVTPEEQAERLLPEWETVQGPMHATPPFHFPVYAKACRPAVAAVLQSHTEQLSIRDERIAVLEKALGDFIKVAQIVSGHGATTGTHWVKLAGQIISARTALSAKGEKV